MSVKSIEKYLERFMTAVLSSIIVVDVVEVGKLRRRSKVSSERGVA